MRHIDRLPTPAQRGVLDNIHRVKKFIKGKSIPDPEMPEVLEMLGTCQIFEVEIYCSQRTWDKVLEVVTVRDGKLGLRRVS